MVSDLKMNEKRAYLIIFSKLYTLFLGAAPAHWTQVDHPIYKYTSATKRLKYKRTHIDHPTTELYYHTSATKGLKYQTRTHVDHPITELCKHTSATDHPVTELYKHTSATKCPTKGHTQVDHNNNNEHLLSSSSPEEP